MDQPNFPLGFVGLDTLGSNLLLNLADHGFTIIGYDPISARVKTLLEQTSGKDVRAAQDMDGLLQAVPSPRLILLLLPAGAPVDEAIQNLGLHRLRSGDILVDCSNSHFADTRLRQITLAENGIHLLGIGLSGGEECFRHGPSVMAGGPREAWEQVKPVFEAVAAKHQGKPCVVYCGPGAAGHYTKMVHIGVAYGLTLLIADAYHLMKRGLGLTDDEMRAVWLDWNRTELAGYLPRITAEILGKVDVKTGQKLIDVIWPVIKEKGAGTWASQEAMELQVPVPCIDCGVAMRDLSIFEEDRAAASRCLNGPDLMLEGGRKLVLGQLRNALHAGMLLVYAQGLGLLRAGCQRHGFDVDFGQLVHAWSNGCSLSSGLLEPIGAAYQASPGLSQLTLDPVMAKRLSVLQEDLRSVVASAAKTGIPVPGFGASLSYYDMLRSTWMPTNLIQAQREYFGAHTYERIDARAASQRKY